MMLVRWPPNVIVGMQACPATPIKITGQQGKTLRIYTIDLLTKQRVGTEATYSITSDPFEQWVAWPTPSNDTLLLFVAEVVDSAGNVVESVTFNSAYLPSGSYVALDGVYDDIVVITKTGFVYNLGPSNSLPVHQFLISIARKPGKIVVYEAGVQKGVIEGAQAIIQLQFRISDTLAPLMANYIDDRNVIPIIYKEPSLAPKLGALSYIVTTLRSMRMSVIGATIERIYGGYNINVTVAIDLYSPIEWRTIVNILLGFVASIAGAIPLAFAIMVAGPISIPVIAGLIGLGAVAGLVIYNTAFRESPSATVQYAETVASTSIQNIQSYSSELKSYLDSLLANGRITQDEYNTIMNYVNKIVSTATNAITELKDAVKKAYDEGYAKAKDEAKVWIIGAGAGGFVAGLLLAPRVERVVTTIRGE